MLEPIRDALSDIELEHPAFIIEALNIVEREYQGLDKQTKDKVESLRRKFDTRE
jgi:hypothetical protein